MGNTTNITPYTQAQDYDDEDILFFQAHTDTCKLCNKYRYKSTCTQHDVVRAHSLLKKQHFLVCRCKAHFKQVGAHLGLRFARYYTDNMVEFGIY